MLPVHCSDYQWPLLAVSIPPSLMRARSSHGTPGHSSWTACAPVRLPGSRMLYRFCHSSVAVCSWKKCTLLDVALKMYLKVFSIKSSCIYQFMDRTSSYFKLCFFSVRSAHFSILKLHFSLEEQAKGLFMNSVLIVLSFAGL